MGRSPARPKGATCKPQPAQRSKPDRAVGCPNAPESPGIADLQKLPEEGKRACPGSVSYQLMYTERPPTAGRDRRTAASHRGGSPKLRPNIRMRASRHPAEQVRRPAIGEPGTGGIIDQCPRGRMGSGDWTVRILSRAARHFRLHCRGRADPTPGRRLPHPSTSSKETHGPRESLRPQRGQPAKEPSYHPGDRLQRKAPTRPGRS